MIPKVGNTIPLGAVKGCKAAVGSKEALGGALENNGIYRWDLPSFTSKLALFKRHLGSKKCYQFSSVAALRKNKEVRNDDIQIYCNHLNVLQKDMQEGIQIGQ
ncbi:hypothetical protein T4A_6620 [Trichinella pseudospiralis]|uniref:Uncharacterized protein n=1 Tax=Trichinella pseudospiralis TaxID=6337 RepID=A0A0V1ESU1_TRIPS|nr:hypothetical protein T4A_6620 [Trichinella pseudospiralis]KRZ28207.1 hypothetical protein T4C_2323 [Trichinella pseudospiralis]